MVNVNPIDKDYIVRWQSDLENTKERPLHKPLQNQSKSTALGGVWNFVERWTPGLKMTVHDRGTRYWFKPTLSLQISVSVF